jgi:hypothetical protein
VSGSGITSITVKIDNFKGIGSILFLKNSLKKKITEKTIKIIPDGRIIRYACTALRRCFPNIFDITVLENANLSEDKIGRPPLWSNDTDLDFCHHAVAYITCQQCIYQPLINFICTLDLEVFNFREKLYDLPFILYNELNSVHVTPLISKGDG